MPIVRVLDLMFTSGGLFIFSPSEQWMIRSSSAEGQASQARAVQGTQPGKRQLTSLTSERCCLQRRDGVLTISRAEKGRYRRGHGQLDDPSCPFGVTDCSRSQRCLPILATFTNSRDISFLFGRLRPACFRSLRSFQGSSASQGS